MIQVHKHEIFFSRFFAETESLWSQSEDFEEKKFWIVLKKNFGSTYAQSPRKCSNIEILAKIEGKKRIFFLENLRRAYKDLI